MPNYRETSVTGSQHQRARRVVIDNPLNGTPQVNFVEETVVDVGAEKINRDAGNLYVAFDPTKQVAIIDPSTGAATGQTVTHAEVYAILHSVYLQAAGERDAAAAAAAAAQ